MKFTHPLLPALLIFFSFVPTLAFAQAIQTVQDFYSFALGMINGIIVPVLFAIAFLYFLYGVFRYFIQEGAAGNPEKRQEGTQFVAWGLFGFFVMFSLWGLVNVLVHTFGFEGSNMPTIPTFNGGTGSNLAQYSQQGNPSYGNQGSPTIRTPDGTILNGSPSGSGYSSGGQAIQSPNGYSNYGSGYGGNQTSGGNSGGSNGSGYGGNQTSGGNTGGSNSDLFGNITGVLSNAGSLFGGNGSNSTEAAAPGGSCTNNTGCLNSGGVNYTCNISTDLCEPESSSNFNCTDDSTADPNGVCANGNPALNSLNQQAPADGEINAGGSCAGNESACSGNLTCNVDANNTCDSSAIGAQGVDSLTPGWGPECYDAEGNFIC
jgi:hypothetical protein